MALLGQASGGWTESSSQLRILNVGVRNAVGVLTDDAFTQTNPPSVTVAATISTQVDQTLNGVLAGSCAFARPDVGSNFHGGPGDTGTIATVPAEEIGYRVLGVYVNSANGNAFENTPGPASGKGTYVSAQGTYASQLYESQALATNGALTAGDDLTYVNGMRLIASLNGYIMPGDQVIGGAVTSMDTTDAAAEAAVRGADTSTLLGVVKMPPDATQNEVVWDQRI